MLHLWLIFSSYSFAADFTLTKDITGPALVGLGAEMNPYLYCEPNRISDDDAKAYERRVIDLAPHHVRIFYLQHWFDGRDDLVSHGDPKTADSFIRACRLAQKAGATIDLTNWFGPWTDPQKQMADFAATLDRLIRKEKLTAVRYVTVQNEPNLERRQNAMTPEKLNTLYRALDAELRSRNLRDQVKIISGDLVGDDQEIWFDNLAKKLAGISDLYSIHAYWDYWDTAKLSRRLAIPRQLVDAMPADARRPLIVEEFGVRGIRKPGEEKIEPGPHEDGTPIALKPLQANELAWFMLEGLNRGYAGFVVWTMEDAWYDRLMPYGLIGEAKDGWPAKPAYHVVRLLTHTTHPGWRALKIEGEKAGVVVAAMGQGDQLSVFALNQSETDSSVILAGLPVGRTLAMLRWNAGGKGTLSADKSLNPAAGEEIRLDLPPLSLIALTTQDASAILHH